MVTIDNCHLETTPTVDNHQGFGLITRGAGWKYPMPCRGGQDTTAAQSPDAWHQVSHTQNINTRYKNLTGVKLAG
jgi:hypothetical protein